MTDKETKSMEEIHIIREKMHERTADMSMHEKLLLIKEQAAAFKTKYGLKTKTLTRKDKQLAGRNR